MWKVGDTAMWRGRKVLIIDTHGYPVRTVDLRWTVSGTPGSANEVKEFRRVVPVSELSKPEV